MPLVAPVSTMSPVVTFSAAVTWIGLAVVVPALLMSPIGVVWSTSRRVTALYSTSKALATPPQVTAKPVPVAAWIPVSSRYQTSLRAQKPLQMTCSLAWVIA